MATNNGSLSSNPISLDVSPAEFALSWSNYVRTKADKNATTESELYLKFGQLMANWYDDVHLKMQARIGSLVKNVREYGATGDGSTDDTSFIQLGLDSLKPGESLFFPSGTYKTGKITITNKNNIKVYGANGAQLALTGAAAVGERIGLELNGTVQNVLIEGLYFKGGNLTNDDPTVDDRHAGVWSSSGQTLRNIIVQNCIIDNCSLGISFNADTSGELDGCVAAFNTLTNMRTSGSSDPGNGYGLHVATGQTGSCNVLFYGNQIQRAQRHSIYVAKGKGINVVNNFITYHRSDITDGAVRGAIAIARSQNVICNGNVLDRNNNCSFIVNNDGDFDTKFINITNNTILNPISSSNPMPQIVVGIDSLQTGTLEDILISQNTVRANSYASDILRMGWGKNVVITNNIFESIAIPQAAHSIVLRADGESSGTNTFSDRWLFEGNLVITSGSNSSPFRLTTTWCTSDVSSTFRNNTTISPNNAFNTQAGITNKNLLIEGLSQDGVGLSFATSESLSNLPFRGSNSATENVTRKSVLRLGNGSATSLSQLLGGYEGQIVTLYATNGNTTIVHGNTANRISLSGSTNVTLPGDTTITVQRIQTVWKEIARSAPTLSTGASDTFNSITVTTSASIGTILTTDDLSVADQLWVGGATRLSSTLDVAGAVVATKDIYGQKGLYVSGTGNSHFAGSVNISGSEVVALDVYNLRNVYISGTTNIAKDVYLTREIFVSGTGQSHFAGDLNVSGNTNLGSTVNALKDVYLTRNLFVSSTGQSHFAGDLNVTGNLVASSSLTVSKDAYFTRQIFVSGTQPSHIADGLRISGSMNVNAGLYVSASIQSSGAISFNQGRAVSFIASGTTTDATALTVFTFNLPTSASAKISATGYGLQTTGDANFYTSFFNVWYYKQGSGVIVRRISEQEPSSSYGGGLTTAKLNVTSTANGIEVQVIGETSKTLKHQVQGSYLLFNFT